MSKCEARVEFTGNEMIDSEKLVDSDWLNLNLHD